MGKSSIPINYACSSSFSACACSSTLPGLAFLRLLYILSTPAFHSLAHTLLRLQCCLSVAADKLAAPSASTQSRQPTIRPALAESESVMPDDDELEPITAVLELDTPEKVELGMAEDSVILEVDIPVVLELAMNVVLTLTTGVGMGLVVVLALATGVGMGVVVVKPASERS